MSLLLESIGVENGEAKLLPYHEKRMNRSRKDLWGITDEINLKEAILSGFAQYPRGLYKCRVLYQQKVEQVEFVPYQRPQIHSLKKVYNHEIDYTYKYADRKALTTLYQQKENCDDILIIKNGLVTDTYFANILFFDGHDWYTPDQPLLRGVQREFLIEQSIVQEKQIREEDVPQFSYFKFVNALNPFDTSPAQAISQIY